MSLGVGVTEPPRCCYYLTCWGAPEGAFLLNNSNHFPQQPPQPDIKLNVHKCNANSTN